MTRATCPLKLPASIKATAARLARADGVSLNQRIATAMAQKIGVVETAAEFLRCRAGDTPPVDLGHCLPAHRMCRRSAGRKSRSGCRGGWGGRRAAARVGRGTCRRHIHRDFGGSASASSTASRMKRV
jgi:hypothetical protein